MHAAPADSRARLRSCLASWVPPRRLPRRIWRATAHPTVEPEHARAEAGEALTQLGGVQLGDARLVVRDPAGFLEREHAQGQKPRYSDDPKRDGLKTKAEIVAFVKKCVDDGAAVIKSKGDKGMAEWITEPESKQQVQISDLAYGLTEHSGEHYGQLVVYYRVAGLVPPESRPKK